MSLLRTSTLWSIQDLPQKLTDPEAGFLNALQQHIDLAGQGLITVLMQIGTQQKSYVRVYGCGSCQVERCVAGCRVRLLERVIRSGWKGTSLSHVSQGLVARPYTRVYIGMPMYDAEPLDGTLLHSWQEARLTLHWHKGRMPQPEQKSLLRHTPGLLRKRIMVSAVLVLGKEGPDDPQLIFGSRKWKFVPADKLHLPLLNWYGGPEIRAPRLFMGTPSTISPHLLLPDPRDPHTNPEPDLPDFGNVPHDKAVIAHANATAISRQLHEAGARVEFLDLNGDLWTATLAAIHPAGMQSFLTELSAAHAGLYVKSVAKAVVGLRNTSEHVPAMLPPVLKLGTLREGQIRYRPIGSTHHMIVSGPSLAGILAGLVAPLVDGRSDVRIGVLDVADGKIASVLGNVPRRLPTVRADDEQELLGVVSSVNGTGVPVMVIVHANDAERCRKAVIPLMRAASYLNISLVIATHDEEIIPERIRNRVPVLRISNRQAHWESPYGAYYEWGRMTPLRLPFRDPELPWSLPDSATVPNLIERDQYWVTPDHLTDTLVPGLRELLEEQSKADGNTESEGESKTPPSDASSEQNDAVDGPEIKPVAEQAKPAVQLFRFDATNTLIVDDELLGPVLQWMNSRTTEPTISIKQLMTQYNIPKEAATQIFESLKGRRITKHEKRTGHLYYETVAEAISNGHLADGPWAVPVEVDPVDATASPGFDSDADETTTQPVMSDENTVLEHHAGAIDEAAPDDNTVVTTNGAPVLVEGAGLWQLTGVQAGAENADATATLELAETLDFGFDREDAMETNVWESDALIIETHTPVVSTDADGHMRQDETRGAQ